jgi:hypothetical protein
LPSDIQLQLNNTSPTINYTSPSSSSVPAPLTLSNLNHINILGNCNNFTNCPLYLTSKDDVTNNPSWFYGVLPDASTHETVGAKSCAVIVYDHGDGIVDAFYHYFYAFNLGLTVLGQLLGNHVGDWEHSMVRFQNGAPISVWLSQHDYGQAFSYSALTKIGPRPIIYSAIGSHANFAVPGTHSRLISTVLVNDTSSAGPLWDPILSAHFYTYQPHRALFPFKAVNATVSEMWLYYYGRWGDERYPDSDPRQVNLYGLNATWKWESGPTGPADKGLVRRDVCPDVSTKSCVTLTTLPAVSGSSIPVTVSRTTPAATTTTTGISSVASATPTAISTSRSTGKQTGCNFRVLLFCLLGATIASY